MPNDDTVGYQAGQNGTLPHYILKQQRLLLGMTQQEVADAAGVSVQQYQKFESGARNLKTASFQVACSVIEALDMDVRDFFHSRYNLGRRTNPEESGESPQEGQKTASGAAQVASPETPLREIDEVNENGVRVIQHVNPYKPMPIQLYCELLFFVPDGKVTTEGDIFDFVKEATGITYSGLSSNSKPYLMRNLCVDYGITKPGLENFSEKLVEPLIDKDAGTDEIPFWKVVTTRGHLTGVAGRYGVDYQEGKLHGSGVETETCTVGTATGIRVKDLDAYRFDWKGVTLNADHLDDGRGMSFSWYNFSLDDLKGLLDQFFKEKM